MEPKSFIRFGKSRHYLSFFEIKSSPGRPFVATGIILLLLVSTFVAGQVTPPKATPRPNPAYIRTHNEEEPPTITNIEVSLKGPASVAYNEQITATFDYNTGSFAGVRIFVRPMSNGQPAPHYAAHGSRSFPQGEGKGDGHFTITTGDVLIDQVRVQMITSDDRVLAEEFVPVSVRFCADPLQMAAYRDAPAQVDSNIVIKRSIDADGAVVITYGDGRVKREFGGRTTITYPDGRMVQVSKNVVFSQAQSPTPPADTEENQLLNHFLENTSNRLLLAIEQLVGKAGREKFENVEAKGAPKTVIQKIDFRLDCIRSLIE